MGEPHDNLEDELHMFDEAIDVRNSLMTEIKPDHIWGDEDGLQLVLKALPGGRVSVGILERNGDDCLLAEVTIANYRVRRIAEFAGIVSALSQSLRGTGEA